MSEKRISIDNPIILMHEHDGDIICHVHELDRPVSHYGMMICDLVRHVAMAYKVEEDDVWEWVDKERHHHTTDVQRAS